MNNNGESINLAAIVCTIAADRALFERLSAASCGVVQSGAAVYRPVVSERCALQLADCGRTNRHSASGRKCMSVPPLTLGESFSLGVRAAVTKAALASANALCLAE